MFGPSVPGHHRLVPDIDDTASDSSHSCHGGNCEQRFLTLILSSTHVLRRGASGDIRRLRDPRQTIGVAATLQHAHQGSLGRFHDLEHIVPFVSLPLLWPRGPGPPYQGLRGRAASPVGSWWPADAPRACI